MKNGFSVKHYKHPSLKFLVRGKVKGKWVRKYFHTKGEAETYSEQQNIALFNHGREAIEFPSWLRVMAQNAHGRLEPHGKTIDDAVSHYLDHLSRLQAAVPISQAIDELIANRRANGASKVYCADLRWRLGRLRRDHPNSTTAGFSTKALDMWLSKLNVGAVTQNTFRRDLNTLFSFCVTRRYCDANPAASTTIAKQVQKPVEILTVNQLAKLLTAATPEWIPYLAIGAFAGLRPSEIARLDWAEIDMESSLIEVKAQKSKTARRRLVKILPNLRAWLRPLAKHEGPIVQGDLRWDLVEIRERAGLPEWPANALRHSYASYHLAHFNDAAALALEMGHTNSSMIFNHYREVVKPKEAARYWSIKPSQQSKKVLEFATA